MAKDRGKISTEIERLNKEIEIAKSLDSVNARLQQFNWIFLHPYNRGLDIEILKKIIEEAENPEEKILHFFASQFLNLRVTIHFLDGFYKQRPFLKDYSSLIDQSVVLCLQKDFGGAISILLPVIEGTLRKYLVHREGDHRKVVTSSSKILKSIDSLIEEYEERVKANLKTRMTASMDLNVDFSQDEQLLQKHKEYFEIWVKQLKNYLENNLYLDTRNKEVKDKFNRHIIFHAFDSDIEFSFNNYLRIFNCIIFLSWVIGAVSDNCSVLSEANEQDVLYKWVDYMNILITSEALSETKKNIYGKDIESFKKYLHPDVISRIRRHEFLVKESLMKKEGIIGRRANKKTEKPFWLKLLRRN